MIKLTCSYLMFILNSLTNLYSYKILNEEKIIINLKNILYFFFFPFLLIFVNLTNVIILKIFANIFFTLIIIKNFYKCNLKKALYYTLILSVFSLISDMIVSLLIVNNKYLINFASFKSKYYFRCLLTFPVCIITILISHVRLIKKFFNEFYSKIFKSKTNSDIITLYLIFIAILISLFSCLNAYNHVNRVGHFILFLGVIGLLLLSCVTLYLIYKEHQINILNRNIVEENKYMKDIARQDKEFKHNLINNLLGIKTVASKKVNQLIDELISEYKTDYKNILNINDLPDGILSIIYRKAYEENIDNLNLAVDNKIKKDLIDMLSPKNYNKFCTSIGILFDNALDAIKSCKEKVIEINFLEDDEYVYCIQKNSFTNVIDLEQTGTREYTTKKSGHGIGLNYVKNLKDIETKNTVINNMFITKLKIKK